MTEAQLNDAIDKAAAKQWQSYVDDKACCTEHAVRTAYANGAKAWLEVGLALGMEAGCSDSEQHEEAERHADRARELVQKLSGGGES